MNCSLRRGLAVVSLFLELTGCKRGPSVADIQSLLDQQASTINWPFEKLGLGQVTPKTTVTGVDCQRSTNDAGAYSCTASLQVDGKAMAQEIVVYNLNGNWVEVQGGQPN